MSDRVRLSLFFAAALGYNGVNLPYWSLWLQDRGLDSAAIGAVMAAGMVSKVLVTPFASIAADRSGERRRVILVMAAIMCLGTMLYAVTRNPWLIALIALAITGPYASTTALADSMALAAARQQGFPYAGTRVWGSISFLVIALCAGPAIQALGPASIVWMVLGLTVLIVLVAWLLPRGREAPSPLRLSSFVTLLRNRPLMRLFLVAGLIQNSHLLYYSFSAIHWRAAGLPTSTTGWLWAEGVIAEILLFTLIGRWGKGLSARTMILAGGAGGTVRWIGTAFTTDLEWLIALQALHAFSFAAAHLGAMRQISDRTPPGLASSAQGLYAALPLGVASALVVQVCGFAYQAWSGLAFLLMAGMCVAGTIVAARIER